MQLKRIFTHNKLQIAATKYLQKISHIDQATPPLSLSLSPCLSLSLCVSASSICPFARRLNVTHHKLCTTHNIDRGKEWKREREGERNIKRERNRGRVGGLTSINYMIFYTFDSHLLSQIIWCSLQFCSQLNRTKNNSSNKNNKYNKQDNNASHYYW